MGGTVVGVIPAGAGVVGVWDSVGVGDGGVLVGLGDGVLVGLGVGLPSGFGRLTTTTTTLGDRGGMAIPAMFTILPTDYLSSRMLSISRVVPTYAATATSALPETSSTGSRVSGFTISK